MILSSRIEVRVKTKEEKEEVTKVEVMSRVIKVRTSSLRKAMKEFLEEVILEAVVTKENLIGVEDQVE